MRITSAQRGEAVDEDLFGRPGEAEERTAVEYVGQYAALGTALCWTVSTLAFEAAGRRAGSMAINLIRLVMAWVILAVFCWLVRGLPLPTDASGDTLFWMALAGLVGFFLCDLCLFRAWVLMGPRLTVLIFSLAPPIAALSAWVFLGEALTWLNWLGMAVTLGGVAWVVAERRVVAAVHTWHVSAWGVTLAVIAAAGQAAASVLIKKGLGDYSVLAATQIRITVGIVGFAVLFAAVNWYPRVYRALFMPRAMSLAALGALAGPVIGVSLLTFSLKHIPAGVTLTLVAILPVLILPFTAIIHREHITLRAAAGAALAVSGVALLFF